MEGDLVGHVRFDVFERLIKALADQCTVDYVLYAVLSILISVLPFAMRQDLYQSACSIYRYQYT